MASDTPELQWKFQQVFGDKGAAEDAVVEAADIISAVEFDETGDFLAIGDKGGRVVLLERSSSKLPPSQPQSRRAGGGASSSSAPPAASTPREFVDYRVLTEFQSHEPEFDYLKSLEIEEKINQVRWCRRQNQSHMLLTTNDKTIKLWKVYDKQKKVMVNFNLDAQARAAIANSIGKPAGSISSSSPSASSPASASRLSAAPSSAASALGAFSSLSISSPAGTLQPLRQLRVPRVAASEAITAHVPRRVFANAHAYHINSISLNSDGETFISADDLRVNLWHMDHSDQSFNIVDIKPANMEELTEVITSASFHPTSCNMFMYSSSKGTIKIADMRSSALCDRHAKVFEMEEEAGSRTFFSEIISSISDAKFSRDGRYILSRDYLTLKLWDLNMESRPLKVINIHEQLRSRLCDLYENECIFDKFECCFSGDGSSVMTGSYKNLFHIYDRQGRTDCCLEATRSIPKRKTSTKSKLLGRAKTSLTKKAEDFEAADFSKKVLHIAWHPTENTIAVAATQNLFLFSHNPQ